MQVERELEGKYLSKVGIALLVQTQKLKLLVVCHGLSARSLQVCAVTAAYHMNAIDCADGDVASLHKFMQNRDPKTFTPTCDGLKKRF